MSSSLILAERREYLQYFSTPYPDITTKTFIATKGHGHTIKQYGDLYGKKIGYHRGGSLFKRFDEDEKLTKIDFTDLEQTLKLLALGRIDVAAGPGLFNEYYIYKNNLRDKVETSQYVHKLDSIGGPAISKTSPFLSRIDEFNRHFVDMKKDGTIRQIYAKYGLEKIYDHEYGLKSVD